MLTNFFCVWPENPNLVSLQEIVNHMKVDKFENDVI